MKLTHSPAFQAGFRRRRMAAMTLVEVMISTWLTVMVILGGLLWANMVGMSEFQYLSAKGGAATTSRMAVNQMLNDIRSAKGYIIGNTTGTAFTTFTPISTGNWQGSSVELFPILISTNESIDYTKYILYAYDTTLSSNSDGVLWRYVSTNATSTIVASNLINSLYFTSENYNGNTNSGTNQYVCTYKSIVHTTLQFCEFVYPVTKVGSNNIFDYYRLDCRATPHLPDGP